VEVAFLSNRLMIVEAFGNGASSLAGMADRVNKLEASVASADDTFQAFEVQVADWFSEARDDTFVEDQELEEVISIPAKRVDKAAVSIRTCQGNL